MVAGVEVEVDAALAVDALVHLIGRGNQEVPVVPRAVRPIRISPVEEVRQQPEGRPVAVVRLLEGLDEERPELLRVHRKDGPGDHVVAVDRPGIVTRGRKRVLIGRVHQLFEGVSGIGAAEAAGALIGCASLEEAPERPLEPI